MFSPKQILRNMTQHLKLSKSKEVATIFFKQTIAFFTSHFMMHSSESSFSIIIYFSKEDITSSKRQRFHFFLKHFTLSKFHIQQQSRLKSSVPLHSRNQNIATTYKRNSQKHYLLNKTTIKQEHLNNSFYIVRVLHASFRVRRHKELCARLAFVETV